MSSTLADRAARHSALGEPSRLRIVEELLVTDRSVRDLAMRLDLPSNLLAHHLDVLEGVALIVRATSSGDRRRRYVKLRRAALDELSFAARSAHPGRVVFVCTHNSARSQLAAAVWRRSIGGSATSAGTHPAERVHPRAVEAAENAGLVLGARRPRRLTARDLSAELVITVCDRAHEELNPEASWRHWSIPDPVEIGTRRAFSEALAQIEQYVRTAALTVA